MEDRFFEFSNEFCKFIPKEREFDLEAGRTREMALLKTPIERREPIALQNVGILSLLVAAVD